MKKKILYTIAVLICIAVIILLIPFAKLLYTEEGRELVNIKIKSFGSLAPIVFISIEILQIVVAFIPGAPLEILSGVLFGGIWGLVFCLIGIFIGTTIVFYLVKRFGKPLVYRMFSKEKLENNRLLSNEKRLTLIIFILFLIPGTPKDLMTYIVPLTDIPPKNFITLAILSRLPSLACSVLMGASLGSGNYIRSLILFAVIAFLSIIGWLVKNKLMKNKSDKSSKHNI